MNTPKAFSISAKLGSGCIVIIFLITLITRGSIGPAGWIQLAIVSAILLFIPWLLYLLAYQESPWLALLQFIAGLLASLSFLMDRSSFAAALTFPWLAFLITLALLSLIQIAKEFSWTPITAQRIGVVLLPVGGIWLFFSRMGTNPFGFSEPIVSLTAVHFHFTTFVVPSLIFLCAKHLGTERTRTLLTIASFGVLSAIITLAIGIGTSSSLFESAGALLFFLSGMVYILVSLVTIPRSKNMKVFICISSLSLLWTLSLAFSYGIREFGVLPSYDIANMVLLHGLVNIVGFVSFGLFGWTFYLMKNVDNYQTVIRDVEFELLLKRLHRYDIFPRSLVKGEFNGKTLKVGTQIRQTYYLGPLPFRGSVTVTHTKQTHSEAEFTVITNADHPEQGEETFRITTGEAGTTFEIDCVSAPKKWYACLGYPLLRYLQTSYTKRALEHFGRSSSR